MDQSNQMEVSVESNGPRGSNLTINALSALNRSQSGTPPPGGNARVHTSLHEPSQSPDGANDSIHADCNYAEADACAQPGRSLIHYEDIPGDGSCLFHSLLKITKLRITALQLRRELLNSPFIRSCANPIDAVTILSSVDEYGDANCLHVFANHFSRNVCVHFIDRMDNVRYYHFRVNNHGDFIHLHLTGKHYTPYLTPGGNEPQSDVENDISMVEAAAVADPAEQADRPQRPRALSRYLVAENTLLEDTPQTGIDRTAEDPQPFTRIESMDAHPFTFRDNLIFFMTRDLNFDSDVLNALVERQYVNLEELGGQNYRVGEVIALERKGIKLFGIVIKEHKYDKVCRPVIKKSLKTLKALLRAREVAAAGFVRDLTMLTIGEWEFIQKQCDALFRGENISLILYKNNLPTPNVADRYALIKEYHESAIGGHKGISKTYARLATEYYWRYMQEDVRQFVRGCSECQTTKLVRRKTKLPMIITDTPSVPFEKISMDFVGPLRETKAGNMYVLTIQDNFSKFCVLTPVGDATAQEVAKSMMKNFISYFGTPKYLISDQGSHFMNHLMEEFAKIFRINKFCTTTYHPQSNGSIERMHHTLKEYTTLFLQNHANDWDELVPLAQHAYNSAEHEALGYSPYEVVFGYRARTPSSFPPREQLATYDEYLADATTALSQLRTLAAMNLVQAKCRSKEYYDRRANVQHFREGEMVYLLKEPKEGKFTPEYVGPCEIIGVNYQTHNVKIQKGNQTRVVHMDKLKRAIPPSQEANDLSDEVEIGNE